MDFSLKALNNHLCPLLYVRIKGYRATELVAPTVTIIIKKTLLADGSKCIISSILGHQGGVINILQVVLVKPLLSP